MTDTPTQLPLPLPVKPALGREDYFVSSSNALAVSMIADWRNWVSGKLLLLGPAGSGKTHLAHVWAADSGARIVTATDLASADIPALAVSGVCVEGGDAIATDPDAQTALFHLHNLVLAQGHPLLVTACEPPIRWGLTLPDLRSRMEGTGSISLGDPDDHLLGALLAKLFADRQIVPAKQVIPYLTKHMPRSFAAAQNIVSELDAISLGQSKAVSLKMASSLLKPKNDES